jgi:hypothetical protein
LIQKQKDQAFMGNRKYNIQHWYVIEFQTHI